MGPALGPGELSAWTVGPLLLSALAASWVLTRGVEGRSLVSLGLRGGAPGLGDLGLGWALGVLLIGSAIGVLAAPGWVSWAPASEPGSAVAAALRLLGLLFIAAFVEELLFRGYPFQVLLTRFGPTTAVVTTSLLFGAGHLQNPNVSALAVVNITLAGALLGVAYLRTGSLWLATGVHVGWNWAMGLTELSVSGLPQFGMPGIEAVVSGPGLWTGGDFGPEGGLVVTIVSLLAIFWMWRLRPRDLNLSALAERPSPNGVYASSAPTDS
ncbi:MAG: CPBP family intramembrane metalloprotease [Gemmatimonadetes bacterium]|nr:CPBP family intramembrane metalloprotease [Gemmatimonadota bacterium]